MERTKFKEKKEGGYIDEIISANLSIASGILTVKIRLANFDLFQATPIYKKFLNKYLLEVEKRSTARTKKKPTVVSLKERTENYTPLAKQLARIIHTKKRIRIPQQRILQWADEIRRVEEHLGVDIERIQKVLDWYAKNIGGEYIPVIESGYTFRMKFSRLEDAMNRKSYSNGQKPFIIDQGIKYVLDEDGHYKHCVTGEIYFP